MYAIKEIAIKPEKILRLWMGFELMTFMLLVCYSNQLSYRLDYQPVPWVSEPGLLSLWKFSLTELPRPHVLSS